MASDSFPILSWVVHSYTFGGGHAESSEHCGAECSLVVVCLRDFGLGYSRSHADGTDETRECSWAVGYRSCLGLLADTMVGFNMGV